MTLFATLPLQKFVEIPTLKYNKKNNFNLKSVDIEL